MSVHTKRRRYLQPSSVKILVPGSGLGRLAFDIAHLGYYCQGNEFSMYMLIASNFVLNRCSEIGGHVIYPWVLQSCNNYTKQDQLSAIHFPDVNPSDLPYYGLFSVAAGDFLEIYSVEDHWDCIACSYFIDTAHNIISYLEKIYEILKPGGLWINFGPLLYHFADIPHELSLELSWEDVRSIALKLGFEILKEEHNCPSSYIQNPNSMMHLNYQCVFLVARKPFPLNNK